MAVLDSIRRTMTLKDELYALFDEGKTPAECIKLGYKRATVYRFSKDYNMDKEKERIKFLTEEAEQIKRVFSDFQKNKSLIQIVTETGMPPDRLRQLYEEYKKLGEIETEYQEKVKALNEIVQKKNEIEEEIKKLTTVRDELRNSIKKLIEKAEEVNVKTFIKNRKELLEDLLELAESERIISKDSDFYWISDEKMKAVKDELDYLRKCLEIDIPSPHAPLLPQCPQSISLKCY